MGMMSRLHLLSGRVLEGETVPSVAEGTSVSEEDIAWATSERLKARCDKTFPVQ